MRVTARWDIMRYVHFADRIKCAWDLVNTAKALAAARPSARTVEESQTSCTRMKWGSFLGSSKISSVRRQDESQGN